MDDPPDRATHPGRSVHRERFEQPQLPGMESVQRGDQEFKDQAAGNYGWRTSNIPLRQAESYQPPQGEQLKMFASAKELMADYRPLEGDRQEYEGDNDFDWDNPSSSNQTWRRRNDNWAMNPMNAEWKGWKGSNPLATSNKVTDTAGNKAYHRSQAGRMETDEELYQRKADEAFDPYGRQGAEGGYHRDAESVEPHITRRSRDTAGSTLEESNQGYTDETFVPHEGSGWGGSWKEVQRPMHRHPGRESVEKFGGYESLGESLRWNGYDWSRHPEGVGGGRFKYPVSVQFQDQVGDEGPSILGGHHRLAAMNQINPETYIPIEYYKNIWEAKSSGHYT